MESAAAPASEILPGSWEKRWHQFEGPTVLLVLALKILLFVFVAQALAVLDNRPQPWLDLWSHWDAQIYARLAREGYASSGPTEAWIVFFPLYPWLVCLFEIVAHDYRLAEILVSGLATIAAAILLRRLTVLDYPARVGYAAVWFFLIFPTSYFLHIGYTESLFLTFALGSLLAGRRERWLLAGALGAAACLTRVIGVGLGPALLIEAWLQYRKSRRLNPQWLWIGLLGVGLGIYLLLNYAVAGDPLAFTHFEKQVWRKSFASPWFGVAELWRGLSNRTPSDFYMIGVYELFAVGLGFAGAIWCTLRLRLSYGVWMFFNLFLITSTSFISSAPRYVLALFPLFIWAAAAGTKRPLVGAILSAASLLFLGLFATKFAVGHWAF